MLKYSIKRIILAFITAFIILSLTFILVKSLGIADTTMGAKPGVRRAFFVDQMNLGYVFRIIQNAADPAPKQYGTPLFTYTTLDGKIEYYFETPILEQYFHWIKNIFTKFDWGTSTSIEPGAHTVAIIAERLPVTMYINIISVVISVPMGIGLGIFAGLKKNTWIDHLISTLVMVFSSIPSFVVISFLMYTLCYQWNLLPSIWPVPSDSTKTKVLAFIIPVMSLSFGPVCSYTRFVRAELCEVMSSEYLLLARTKGLTKNQAITRHALKNSFVPILPSILSEFIGIFFGSFVLEKLYGIPGVGDLYIRAISEKDYNVLMVDCAIIVIVGLLAGIVFDLSYGFIDPRIRMGEKKA